MTKSSIALIFLASVTVFSGVARADETITAGNKESARVARESAGVFIGDANEGARFVLGHAESRPHGWSGAHAASDPVLSQRDRTLFQLGDRGIGNG